MAALCLGSLLTGACRDERGFGRSAADGGVVRGAVGATALDSLTVELAAVRKALTAGEVSPLACEAAELVAGDLRRGTPSVPAMAALAELERLCGREVPLVAAGRALGRIDERRGAAGPAEPRRDAADCAAAERAATVLRERHAAEPAVAALLQRLAATCPGEAPAR